MLTRERYPILKLRSFNSCTRLAAANKLNFIFRFLFRRVNKDYVQHLSDYEQRVITIHVTRIYITNLAKIKKDKNEIKEERKYVLKKG